MPKRKWLPILLIGLAVLAILVGVGAYLVSTYVVVVPDPFVPKQPVTTLGPAAATFAPGELKKTTVTAHLGAPIEKDRNLLYCATAQLAWNELCKLAGGPVKLSGNPPAAAALNRREVTRADLDEASLVAVAGFGGPALAKKIRAEIAAKQAITAAPRQLGPIDALPPGELAAYCLLAKGLPFEWAFDRQYGMAFAGEQVQNWGIHQYTDSEEREKKAAAQLHLYDYKSKDDFILEIDTRSKSDQLILAKVPPAPTLKKLVEAVSARMAASKPETGMDNLANMEVPIIDFDVAHDFAELSGKRITAPGSKANGKQLAVARQAVRFRLDERGVTLFGEMVIVTCISEQRDFIFDEPFLVMIRKRNSKLPYFALWVANGELLAKKAPEPSGPALERP